MKIILVSQDFWNVIFIAEIIRLEFAKNVDKIVGRWKSRIQRDTLSQLKLVLKGHFCQ